MIINFFGGFKFFIKNKVNVFLYLIRRKKINGTIDLSSSGIGHDIVVKEERVPFKRTIRSLQKTNLDVRFYPSLDIELNYPPKYVVSIKKGIVHGLKGFVLTKDFRLIRSIALDFDFICQFIDDFEILKRRFISKPKKLKGRALSLVSQAGGDNYFHWMIDVLPKLFLYKKSSYAGLDIDYYIFNPIKHKFSLELLELLNIPKEKIIEILPYQSIQVDELLATSPPSITSNEHRLPIPHWIINNWRRSLLELEKVKPPNNPYSKIYINRLDSKKRPIQNEHEVIEYFEDNGFKSITLSKLSVINQISLFANADIIIGPHGAGFTNILFCKKETVLVEIFSFDEQKSSNIGTVNFANLANQLSLNYYVLQIKKDDLPNQTSNTSFIYEIDNLISKAVKQILL